MVVTCRPARLRHLDSDRAGSRGDRANELRGERAFFSVDPPHDLAERLGKVTAPVLIVAGAQDCSAGTAQVIALAKLFPAGKAVTIERCGHQPWVEQPTAFRHEVDQFLSTLPHRPH